MSEFLSTVRIVVFPKGENIPQIHSFQIRSSLATVPLRVEVLSHTDRRRIVAEFAGRGRGSGHFFYREK